MGEIQYTLVTGASAGIGKAIAIELSKTDNLILHGRDRNNLEETLRLCSVGNHVIWAYDLSKVDALQSDFEQTIVDNKLAISRFVHCAGMALPCAIRTVESGSVRQIVDVNAISAILLAGSLMKRRVAAKTMKAMVFISSVSAEFGTSGSAVYGASKARLDGFVRSMAVELAPSVRVNAIRPGFVESGMTDSYLSQPGVKAAVSKRHPLGIGVAEDIAKMVRFLISSEARWVTGQSFVVDGGVSCNLTFLPTKVRE